MVGNLVHAVVRHVTDRNGALSGSSIIHRIVPHSTADNHLAFLQPVNDPGGEGYFVKNNNRISILYTPLEFAY